jgi:hypothetical protein
MNALKFIPGIALSTVVALSVGSARAEEYAVVPVPDGGTLSGTVTLKGTPPPPKQFDLAKFPNMAFCAKFDSNGEGHRLVQQVNVGKRNALKDVVVYMEVKQGKPFEFTWAGVKADGCRFLAQGPSTLAGVVVKKKEIRIENMDADPADPKAVTGVLHNPHGYEVYGSNNASLFNLPLPEKGQVIRKSVILRKKESILKIECDQHNYMQVFFHPVDNPYYAIVGDDGTFQIDQIPPGEYEMHAWHPVLGTQETMITVTANGQAKADFTFAAK